MASVGYAAVVGAFVVASLVGGAIILPALGLDPLGVGAKMQVTGLLGGAPAPPGDGPADGNVTPALLQWPVQSRLNLTPLTREGRSDAGAGNATSFETPPGHHAYVRLTLTWTEQAAPQGFRRMANDSFVLTLQGPHNITFTSANATNGTLVLLVPLAERNPYPASVNASDAAAAAKALQEAAPQVSGSQGTWTVTVTCETAGRYGLDGGALGPIEVPADRAPKDDGNAWHLAIEYATWEAAIGEPSANGTAPGGDPHAGHRMG